MTQSDDDMLEGLFAEARKQSPPELPADLRARMMADAMAEQAQPEPIPAMPSLWSRALDAIGGWASVGGLATAAISGVYIGFSNPDVMNWDATATETAAYSEIFPSDDLFFDEDES